ncbi:MAG: DUF2079 domain-containing protein [Clostridia bacterium]|nr:DUF2079 domain-containing protein [Clostridia bacterium]
MLGFFKSGLGALTYKNVISKIILSIITISFFTTAASSYKFNTAEYFNSISFGGYFFSALLLFALLIFLLPEKLNGYTMIFISTALFYITNSQEKNIYFALVSSLVVGGMVFYFANQLKFPKLNKKIIITLCIVLGALFTLFVGGITIIKFLNHRTPNFDFGIFSQMYHYLSKTFIPYTTCERDMLLSHFAVHFSPILYLGLPFYWVFPHPSTILALQAFVVALGILPIYKLAKHFNLSNNKTLAVIIIYVLHPTVIANNFYYFHENCFLTVLLLFTFYFAEKGKSIPTYIFALLTMMVKEDAPIYVLFFGLYLLFSNKSKLKGTVLCSISVIYFAVVTKLMSVFGQGIMTYRYENFIFEQDGSIYSVVINIIKNPAYLFEQLLKIEKLEFLVLMLVPMALLPFAIKKPSRLILILPMVLINLMTEYKYQYDIGFQYTYATVAFLFYATIINLNELDKRFAKRLLICAVCSSLIFFASVNLQKTDAIKTYENEKYIVETINKALDTIPMDRSIKSSTFFIPALWNRDLVYQYDYSDEETDYVVFDLRWDTEYYDNFKEQNSDKYKEVLYQKYTIAIFEAKQTKDGLSH